MRSREVLAIFFIWYLCVFSRAFAEDISRHIYITVEVPKKKVSVNEKLPITIQLHSDWLDIENIVLSQEQSENLIIKKFGDRTVKIADESGNKYIILEYTSSLTAVTPGEYTPPPIEVKFEVARPQAKKGQAEPKLLNSNKDFYDQFIGAVSRRTVELKTEPFTITVMPAIEEAPSAKEVHETFSVPAEGMKIVGIKRSPGRLSPDSHHLYRNPIVIIFAALPFLIAIGASVLKRRLVFLKNNPKYAALLSAARSARRNIARAETFMARGDTDGFYNTVFKTMQEYLGKRSLLPTEGVTAMVVDDLEGLDIGTELKENIRSLFARCYRAKYAGGNLDIEEMRDALKNLISIVEDMNKRRFDE